MAKILIRLFEEKDLQTIKDLLKIIEWAEQYIVGQITCIRKLTNQETGEVLVAVNDQMLVGFIQAEHHKWNHLSYISGLVIHPDFRKMGIARNLVQSIEMSSQKRGNRGIYVDTPVNNIDARQFYLSIGLNEAYTMPEFYEPGLDGVTFQKFFIP